MKNYIVKIQILDKNRNVVVEKEFELTFAGKKDLFSANSRFIQAFSELLKKL